jgi:protein-tyrosine-phosphatase/DNA-binding HxlR family transcriptional regulator
MNIDRVPGEDADLHHRAAVFAALADPTRLRVVDVLSVGDAASSELSVQLGVPSNLLAHHLAVLESAGVIARHRSEGDGRRSYWRLVEHTLDALAAPSLPVPDRVVFVCTANSARSHLAAALWRRASPIPAASAGTQPARAITPGALATARRHGLDLPAVAPQHLSDVTPALGAGDLLVTVCDRVHEEIGAAARLHWSVPDPVAVRGRTGFDRAYDDLAARVARLAPLLARAS